MNKATIIIDEQGKAWLRLPKQLQPIALSNLDALTIHEMIHPFIIVYQRILYQRGYVTTPGGQLRPSILRSH